MDDESRPQDALFCRLCGGPMPPPTPEQARHAEPRVFCSPEHARSFHRRGSKVRKPRLDVGRLQGPIPGCLTPWKWIWSDPFAAQAHADVVGHSVYPCENGDRLHYHVTSEAGEYRRYDDPGDDAEDIRAWDRDHAGDNPG